MKGAARSANPGEVSTTATDGSEERSERVAERSEATNRSNGDRREP
jgi:hypothetical protein